MYHFALISGGKLNLHNRDYNLASFWFEKKAKVNVSKIADSKRKDSFYTECNAHYWDQFTSKKVPEILGKCSTFSILPVSLIVANLNESILGNCPNMEHILYLQCIMCTISHFRTYMHVEYIACTFFSKFC